MITRDENEWPAGEYAVREQIGDSHIYGYSYFTLTRPTFIEPAPEIPVACGACTAFMLKIMLWMYDVDFDIITERRSGAVADPLGKRFRQTPDLCCDRRLHCGHHRLPSSESICRKQIVRERLGI